VATVENKELVRRYFDERWNRHNLDICDELLAPSFAVDDAKEFVRSFHAAFANIQLTILDLLTEGNQVAVHWRVTGKHQGEYLGVPATGKSVTYQGIALLRVEDGKIVDDIAYWDNLSILQQLGAVPG